MTQIFQHKEDKERGDITLSLKLGIIKTFLFSGVNFLVGGFLLTLHFYSMKSIESFYLFLLFMLPTIIFFSYWFCLCFKKNAEANFKNCMRLNALSTLSFCLFFLTI